MPDNSALIAFTIAALVVLVIPGPAVLYVVACSLSQGIRAGLISLLGLSIGTLVHVFAATVGLSAILLASATAFNVIKLLGAGYLIWLGLRTLFRRGRTEEAPLPAARSEPGLFMDGVVISVFNPKAAIFFLAFLPQFADPAAGSIPFQIFTLGVMYVLLALMTDGAYVLLSGSLRGWLGDLKQSAFPRIASGLVYIGLGVATALVDRRG